MELGFAATKDVPVIIVWPGEPFVNHSHFSDEQRSILGLVREQYARGIKSALIFDNAVDLPDFTNRIFPEIVKCLPTSA